MKGLQVLIVLCALGCGLVFPGEAVRSVTAQPSISGPLDSGHDVRPCDKARENEPDSLVLSTEDPVSRVILTRETLQTKPPFLVVSVGSILNEARASIAVDVELAWQSAEGARTTVPIGVIAPLPPDRADNQLMRAREAFEQFSQAQAMEELREVALVFTLQFLHEESRDELVEVHIAEIHWYYGRGLLMRGQRPFGDDDLEGGPT